MRDQLTYSTVSEELLAAFPQITQQFDKEFKWQGQVGGEPGQYDLIRYVVKPHVRKVLDDGSDTQLLVRIFSFFERMALSTDIQVVNLLQVGVFESLIREPKRLATAWEYMGPETKKVARNAARIWRYEENLPEKR